MDTKRATDITVVSYVFVLLFLTLSGTLDGAFSEIAYIAAFLLPPLFGLLAARRLGVSPTPLKMKRAALPIVVHSVFPTVTLLMLISVLTSYILSLTGAKNEVTVYETLGENILRHALLPAILEEAAFRYLPLSVFGKGGRFQWKAYHVILTIFGQFFFDFFYIRGGVIGAEKCQNGRLVRREAAIGSR